MAEQPLVLLTGATGYVGGLLLPLLEQQSESGKRDIVSYGARKPDIPLRGAQHPARFEHPSGRRENKLPAIRAFVRRPNA